MPSMRGTIERSACSAAISRTSIVPRSSSVSEEQREGLGLLRCVRGPNSASYMSRSGGFLLTPPLGLRSSRLLHCLVRSSRQMPRQVPRGEDYHARISSRFSAVRQRLGQCKTDLRSDGC